MSLGIVTRILSIVLLSDKIVSNYILIAIIYTFLEILYWRAHEFIYITNNDNRKKYMYVKKIL